jgi:GTPase
LFETLTTKKRTISLGKGVSIEAVDTIGFISDLPTQLVPTFSSSLKVLSSTDVFVLVVDISHPLYLEQFKSVLKTIEDAEYGRDFLREKSVLVLNKLDLLETKASEKLEEVQSFLYDYFSKNTQETQEKQDARPHVSPIPIICTDAVNRLGV